MTNKHTSAPWIEDINEYTSEPSGWISSLTENKHIIQYNGCGSHEAEWKNPLDKKLVLAAPDLLEALKEVASWVDGICGDLCHNDSPMILVREAITKAEGK